MTIQLSQRRAGASRQLIGELMRQGIEHPEVLSLAAGFVDSTTLPTTELQHLAAELFADHNAARRALQYDTAAGDVHLRSLLRQYVADQDGVDVTSVPGVEQIVVTAGANQYLSLVCETLFDPGDICLVAGPTYFVFLGTLHGVLAEPQWVKTDAEGMLPESLEDSLKRLEKTGQLSRVKAAYIVSDHDNPAATFPGRVRREQLLDVVFRWRHKQPIVLIEDAAYRELNYGIRREPSFRQLDPTSEAVIYTQTFSKSFSPGLRVGYGIAPQVITEGILDRKANEDFGSPHLNQCLLASAIETGLLRKHVAMLRDAYQTKRDAMLNAIEQNASRCPGVSWSRPDGGLYVWLTFPDTFTTEVDSPFWSACVNDHQVMYVPGDLCFADTHGPSGTSWKPRNTARLSFGVLPPELIAEGIGRLFAATDSLDV